MNKPTIIAVILAVIIIGSAWVYWTKQSPSTTAIHENTMANQDQMKKTQTMAHNQSMKPTDAMMQSRVILMTKGTGVITDTKGMTLYTYDKDANDVSNCFGKCLQIWPPFIVKEKTQTTLENGLGTFKRTDGAMQYTWKGMPLYYYVGDKKPGDVKGDGFGGVWHVAK